MLKFTLPDNKDILILLVAIAIVAVSNDQVIPLFISDKSTISLVQLLSSFVLFMSIVNSPMGIRFRNFYFSLIWVLLATFFYMSSENKITFLPLLGFIIYQILRMIYWALYNQELIPNFISRSGFDFRFSKAVNRKADNSDFLFSMLLFLFGMAVMVIYMIFVVRKWILQNYKKATFIKLQKAIWFLRNNTICAVVIAAKAAAVIVRMDMIKRQTAFKRSKVRFTTILYFWDKF